jgi:hypothetical protein
MRTAGTSHPAPAARAASDIGAVASASPRGPGNVRTATATATRA